MNDMLNVVTGIEGAAPDGQPVRFIELKHADGHRLNLMDWGATWLSCHVPTAGGTTRQVLLGCASLTDWLSQKAYFGATVGRYANRIDSARFERAGHIFILTPNQQDKHQLHGGPQGFSQRRWRVAEQSESHVVFALHSGDFDQGFPGNLFVQVTYRLEAGCRISMAYVAEIDRACPVNLTNHAYFNLDGDSEDISDVLDHRLQIRAARYVPTDAELIPLGDLRAVAGTSFDFRLGKTIGAELLSDAQQKLAGGYDHAWLLDHACKDMQCAAATLTASDGRLSMDVFTTMPALQFYSGNVLAGTPNRHGGAYRIHQGLALETQFLPDSPNHPEWPQASCWLEPGETYRHRTELMFRIS